MTLPGYCKQALTDLPTSNISAGVNYFVINEQRWYFYNGTQWVKHEENITDSQVTNLLNLPEQINQLSASSSGFSSFITSTNTTLNNINSQIQSLQNNGGGGAAQNNNILLTGSTAPIITPSNGQMYLDVSANKFYLGSNGNWHLINTSVLISPDIILYLMGNSDTIIDSSSNNLVLSATAGTSSNQSKFGGKSIYFSGNTNIQLPSNSVLNLLNDFTIEFWIFPTDASNSKGILSYGAASGIIIENSKVAWWLDGGGNMFSNNSTAINVNTWYHIAVTKENSSLFLYQDGIKIGNGSLSSSVDLRAKFIGSRPYSSNLAGYIDNLRISNKAIYTPNLYPNGFNLPDENFNVTAREAEVVLPPG